MIYLNENELSDLHVGDKEIQRVLFGDKLVWENNKIVALGTGKSFDLTSVLRKYNELTVDNIFYLNMASVTGSDSRTNVGQEVGYIAVIGWMHKIYNQETGLLETDHYANSGSANVSPVLVTDLSKIEYVGTAKTFDIKSLYPDEYQRFTADNFLLKIDASREYLFNHFRGQPGTWWASVTQSLEKSYDPATGILTCQIRSVGTSNVSSDNFNTTGATSVYLTRKTL